MSQTESNNQVPISQEKADEILASPRITEILPYSFENGATINDMTMLCDNCTHEVPLEDMAAHIYFETESSFALRGHAICHRCHTFTPFEARFSDDGICRCREKDYDWVEMVYATPPTMFSRITNALFALFGGNR